jgi:sugar/nucleoside kinase (ribokinase family)
MSIDFLAIGDTVVDEFIKLQEAEVHCDKGSGACEICMRWGDKIPFEMAVLLAGVGNAANAAVAAARMGLPTALMATVGEDDDGRKILATLKNESIDTGFITEVANKRTNHHYVLWFESERTILVKPEPYEYHFPSDIEAPKAIYLSSLGDTDQSYYEAIADFANKNPETFLTFQPGTFQMKMGVQALTSIYAPISW